MLCRYRNWSESVEKATAKVSLFFIILVVQMETASLLDPELGAPAAVSLQQCISGTFAL